MYFPRTHGQKESPVTKKKYLSYTIETYNLCFKFQDIDSPSDENRTYLRSLSVADILRALDKINFGQYIQRNISKKSSWWENLAVIHNSWSKGTWNYNWPSSEVAARYYQWHLQTQSQLASYIWANNCLYINMCVSITIHYIVSLQVWKLFIKLRCHQKA